ncbi:hypothetical protein HPT29_028525 (plasmid) [Microvirga terrae]|uniref:Uncharacterized protein n=1 Tax=Microvirga terrae TaxID=2740529 RepID=A0ABY5S2X9_9HYPH|nr:hypothetical protein [Microvirga terrae]UVF22849.1 hypothetical protein HPT29_028525 [Microvirga terrae]
MKRRLKADLYLPRRSAGTIQPPVVLREEKPSEAPTYTVDRLPGGCVVIGLPGGQAAWRAAHKDET